MPALSGPIIEAIVELSEAQQLRVTVTESLKGGLIAGSCAFAGGLLGGPIGIGVGGVIGACMAAAKSQGKFKPLAQVITEDMTDEQKERLAMHVQRAIQNVRKEDILMLLPLLMQSTSLQTLAVNAVKDFMLHEMRMRLV